MEEPRISNIIELEKADLRQSMDMKQIRTNISFADIDNNESVKDDQLYIYSVLITNVLLLIWHVIFFFAVFRKPYCLAFTLTEMLK